jgi:acetylornithine deacetylase/succinyl-diaminopimelate desuccinylase-like protein
MLTDTLPSAAQQLVERARGHLDADRVAELVYEMTAVPSPTGEELELARLVVDHMRANGVDARVQPIEGRLANAVARLGRAAPGSPRLLLYAPIDTAFAANRDEDAPWLGDRPRADFALPPTREGHRVVGLGAENPKAFAAAAVVAIEALVAAGADIPGELLVGLVGGSMPVIDRPAVGLRDIGHGTGVRYLLENGGRPDVAIVLKPGYVVSFEEVGLAWFRLVTRGTVNYTGIRHKGPYRNPILLAGRLMTHLEAWFAEYAREQDDGVVTPQASINAIHAGSPDRLAFVPQACELDLDVRVPPALSPADVAGELRVALDAIEREDPELAVEMHRITATPGTRTDPDHWIVQSLIAAWEWREGRDHVPGKGGSGASDAALLRGAGIPTARIGLPPPAGGSPFPGFSMGVADADSIVRLAEVLIRAVVDTCIRTKAEIGLA